MLGSFCCLIAQDTLITQPSSQRTKAEIDALVAQINQAILAEEVLVESVFDDSEGPCETRKYFLRGKLIKLTHGCGDCSVWMFQNDFYVHNQTLILVDLQTTFFGYNPCWQKEDLEADGLTEVEVKSRIKRRTVRFYFDGESKLEPSCLGASLEEVHQEESSFSATDLVEWANELLHTQEQ